MFQQKTKNQPINANKVGEDYTLALKKLGIDKEGRKIDVHSFRRFFISYLQKEAGLITEYEINNAFIQGATN